MRGLAFSLGGFATLFFGSVALFVTQDLMRHAVYYQLETMILLPLWWISTAFIIVSMWLLARQSK